MYIWSIYIFSKIQKLFTISKWAKTLIIFENLTPSTIIPFLKILKSTIYRYPPRSIKCKQNSNNSHITSKFSRVFITKNFTSLQHLCKDHWITFYSDRQSFLIHGFHLVFTDPDNKVGSWSARNIRASSSSLPIVKSEMSSWPRDAPLPRPIIVGQLFYFPSPPLPSFPRTISPSPPLSLARGQRSNFIFSTQPPSVARDRHFDIITTFQRKNFRSLSPLPCSSSINCLEEGEREREKKKASNID